MRPINSIDSSPIVLQFTHSQRTLDAAKAGAMRLVTCGRFVSISAERFGNEISLIIPTSVILPSGRIADPATTEINFGNSLSASTRSSPTSGVSPICQTCPFGFRLKPHFVPASNETASRSPACGSNLPSCAIRRFFIQQRYNGNVHRAAAKIIVSKSRAARGSVCNVLLSGSASSINSEILNLNHTTRTIVPSLLHSQTDLLTRSAGCFHRSIHEFCFELFLQKLSRGADKELVT